MSVEAAGVGSTAVVQRCVGAAQRLAQVQHTGRDATAHPRLVAFIERSSVGEQSTVSVRLLK